MNDGFPACAKRGNPRPGAPSSIHGVARDFHLVQEYGVETGLIPPGGNTRLPIHHLQKRRIADLNLERVNPVHKLAHEIA